MNEPLACWLAFFSLALWYAFINQVKKKCDDCNQCRHGTSLGWRFLGFFYRLIQWYTLAFVLLVAFFAKTFVDIIHFDVIKYHMLNPDLYQANLDMIPACMRNVTEEQDEKSPENIMLPSWLRWISILSPFAGLVAFVFCAVQSYQFYQAHNQLLEEKAKRLKQSALELQLEDESTPGAEKTKEAQERRDKHEERERNAADRHEAKNLRTILIGMPLVFIVLAMRASIRIWSIMTGSAWLKHAHIKDCESPHYAKLWKSVKTAELSTYRQDLEVASGFQFFAVGCFGIVCMNGFKKRLIWKTAERDKDLMRKMSDKEHQKDNKILMNAAILGLWSFVVLGVIKTVVNVICAMLSVADPKVHEEVSDAQAIFLTKVNSVFLLATILSVVNMVMLGKMKTVSEEVGGVNSKFNATRALLLIGQGQQLLLAAVTTNSPLYIKITDAIHLKIPTTGSLFWYFSEYQAMLLNSSLLCYECLAVVIVNYYVWKNPVVVDQNRNSAREPLLP